MHMREISLRGAKGYHCAIQDSNHVPALLGPDAREWKPERLVVRPALHHVLARSLGFILTCEYLCSR